VSYALTDAFPNTKLYFRLAAVNAAGVSAFSNVASAVTVPRAPEGLMASEVSK
jgi:hypothetical protein